MNNYTHFAIYKPTGKIVNGWDYNGYSPEDLRQFKKDYFINDLIDMGMDPKQIIIINKKTCEKRGINVMDNSNWQNYPFNEDKTIIKINETQLRQVISDSIKDILRENIYDEEYEEIIPLHDIFTNGFTFNEYYREQILLNTTLCDKNGNEIGMCLNDLCLKHYPNKK